MNKVNETSGYGWTKLKPKAVKLPSCLFSGTFPLSGAVSIKHASWTQPKLARCFSLTLLHQPVCASSNKHRHRKLSSSLLQLCCRTSLRVSITGKLSFFPFISVQELRVCLWVLCSWMSRCLGFQNLLQPLWRWHTWGKVWLILFSKMKTNLRCVSTIALRVIPVGCQYFSKQYFS